MDTALFSKQIAAFRARNQAGADPLAALYSERRKGWSLFSKNLSDAEMEALRPYVFCYDKIPSKPGDAPISIANFIAGEWRAPKRGRPS